jgi:hypothetical protein
MKFTRRIAVFALYIASLLFLGMLFWTFIYNEIITPTATAVWLFMRIFILSIDQKYIWGAVILIIFVFLFRIIPRDTAPTPNEESPEVNETIYRIGYWRNLFTLTAPDIHFERILRQELIRLLVARYSSDQHRSNNFQLYEALHTGEIPLPVNIHAFLFPDKPKKSGKSFRDIIRSILIAPQKWMRRWTGKETAELYRNVDEVLRFIENSMEKRKND